jgi:hypothetical protein
MKVNGHRAIGYDIYPIYLNHSEAGPLQSTRIAIEYLRSASLRQWVTQFEDAKLVDVFD